ncbi:hypothetical protein A1O3_07602 [Capronia epimyces CBS 606.96]|uniref:Cytochrome b5 heme-binding domain-containing protein n=1 Tax=Capronia epimyces CBS 606.96 TaxID=1182542 RepID=W9XLA5_9EURO|nr:uncharacterized protein A1O3_07602 [Capronia epimyces CBS 606.96]EXJ81312.1 hypothetical protein A1O3_07602 [Capronia epimyces CBS 606.96]
MQQNANTDLDTPSNFKTTLAPQVRVEANRVRDSAPRAADQNYSEKVSISTKSAQVDANIPDAADQASLDVQAMQETAPTTSKVPHIAEPTAPPSKTPTGPSSPPRLKPARFAAPPRPGNGLMRPPPSAAASLRMPPTKALPNASLAPTSSIMPPGKQVSRKVILEPGHSPLDWAALTSNPDSRLRGKDAPENLIRVTPTRLKQQNGRKGKDAWTVYNGKVYNITPYVPFHPGGKGEIMRGAGKDSVKLFMEVHPWVNWDAMLSECLVGILVGDDEETDNRSGGLDDMD